MASTGGVDVLERGEDARGHLVLAISDAPRWPRACAASGSNSLISWIATIGKFLAKSRNHMPNQPNEPGQDAPVGPGRVHAVPGVRDVVVATATTR